MLKNRPIVSFFVVYLREANSYTKGCQILALSRETCEFVFVLSRRFRSFAFACSWRESRQPRDNTNVTCQVRWVYWQVRATWAVSCFLEQRLRHGAAAARRGRNGRETDADIACVRSSASGSLLYGNARSRRPSLGQRRQWLYCKKWTNAPSPPFLFHSFPFPSLPFPFSPAAKRPPENQLMGLGAVNSLVGSEWSPGRKCILVYFELENHIRRQHFWLFILA